MNDLNKLKYMPSQKKKFERLEERIMEAEAGGGQERIDRQHAAGRKTARERIDRLIDP